MRKVLKCGAVFILLAISVYMMSVISDRITLNHEILRLHVVANSDSERDQAVKLKVRDAVIAELEQTVAKAADKEAAETLVKGKLPDLEQAANEVLAAEGFSERATVTLTAEEFPTRYYDTFALPAGVYDSLRITIGSGEGHNWWCVVFPSLCVPAAVEGVEDTAASAGFSDSLSGAITGEQGYEVRFFVLDCLGRLQNFFHLG